MSPFGGTHEFRRRCFVRTQSGAKMTFTSAQYSQLAQGYDEAAADPFVRPERKAEFAGKAEWFHFLARRGKMSPSTGGAAESDVGPLSRDIVIEPTSSAPNRRSIAPFLTTLWLTGAVLYLFSTLLFANAINLFGDSEGETAVTEANRPVEPLPQVATVSDDKENHQGGQQWRPSSDTRHARLPNQPAFEAADPTAPPASLPEQKLDTPQPPSEPVQDVGDQSIEVLTVTAAATIRNAPSTTAKKIGTANPGAELEVKARETGWVQFVDPSSGNTGWIHSSLVASASEARAKGLATTQEAEMPNVETPKPKLANKRAKKKPSTPAQVSQQQRKYVDLPEDEQFLSPRRRGPGFLAKRRMLRQGLMSPEFLPPR